MVKSGDNAKLIGEYSGKVVSGHRIALPAALRKLLGSSFIMTKGYEGCILVVPMTSWEKLMEPMESRSFLDRNVRDSLRFLVGSAFEVQGDVQGRVVVPETLRDYAKTQYSDKRETEVVFVGLVNWIEIWEKGRWEERNAYLEENADGIAQELISVKEVV
ncbi:cell division/cell wall cluster transcriptional repressor MraZ [bacterium]|nr:cell division/cell wall cluster transcriptional repressor MraZ [bacterium]